MGKAHDAACAQTRNLLAEGRPNRSRVRLNLIREAGDPDATAAYAPGGGCAVVEQRTSAFKLRAKASFPLATGGRTTTGRRRLSKALAVLAQRVNALRDEVLSTGEVGEFRLILIPVPKRVQGMIRGLARRHTLSVAKSLSVAKCESNFNPHAYNPAGPWAGVYQQDTDYWPGRAKRFGHPGESVFDPYANIDVSLKMARGVGWGHWACG
jgi:soluble lytic murein transglycosylase-like protein